MILFRRVCLIDRIVYVLCKLASEHFFPFYGVFSCVIVGGRGGFRNNPIDSLDLTSLGEHSFVLENIRTLIRITCGLAIIFYDVVLFDRQPCRLAFLSLAEHEPGHLRYVLSGFS
jgi:hypothetical protein